MSIIKRYDTDSDCVFLRQKYLEVYGYEFDLSYYSQNDGQIWLYVDSDVSNGYEGGTTRLESISVVSDLYYPFSMSSDREVNTYVEFNVYTYATLTLTSFNNEIFTTTSYIEDKRIESLREFRFLICGCSPGEVKCGTCCLNCCELAQEIKGYQENMLL